MNYAEAVKRRVPLKPELVQDLPPMLQIKYTDWLEKAVFTEQYGSAEAAIRLFVIMTHHPDAEGLPVPFGTLENPKAFTANDLRDMAAAGASLYPFIVANLEEESEGATEEEGERGK